MKLKSLRIQNFRRLECVEFSIENEDTVFVGPNNSGKTSATDALRLFLGRSGKFSIHDFTVSRIADLNKFGFSNKADDNLVPHIDLDLWFNVNPDTEFGRVFELIPNVSNVIDEVGIRIKWCVNNSVKLLEEYTAAFPKKRGIKTRKTMAHYLSLSGNFTRHFQLKYFSLERIPENVDETSTDPAKNKKPGNSPECISKDITETVIDPAKGKNALNSLIRVDFVVAQRNINDQNEGRGNRLSAAFADFYKMNLTKPDENEKANKIIDENNAGLTRHYEEHFDGLLNTISELGVPSVHDRTLKLVSSLSPQDALQGNTELYYVDKELSHNLPEDYNGLGFKNLVYMAIQVSHFHTQWISTKDKRPLCQLILIEEPEVHLHAQVQQTFIANIWKIVHKYSKSMNEEHMVPQIIITTHSSHVLDTVEFEKVRYFRRCPLACDEQNDTTIYNASEVLNLRNFKSLSADYKKTKKASAIEDSTDTLNFLKRYMKLTHCDLFFADAAILIEGTVEKMLLPQMIKDSAKELNNRYLTTLEVGGAYAHVFSQLLEFIGIPYLVITDIDSVDPKNNRKACPPGTTGSVTSNAALNYFLKEIKVSNLIKMTEENQSLKNNSCFVTFQKPATVAIGGKKHKLHGRTLEEAFVYENFELMMNGSIHFSKNLEKQKSTKEITTFVYEQVRSDTFKKTEFALSIMMSGSNWITPEYIAEGLKWLETKLSSPIKEKTPTAHQEVEVA